MDYSENADILGQPTLPVVHNQPKNFSVTKSLLVLTAVFVCYVVAIRIRREVLIWREQAYKLETRRRHGIPDNDRRPFNVAYAAAMLAREEKEKNPARRLASKPVQNQIATNSYSHAEGFRNRSDRFRSATVSLALPGAYVPSYVASTSSHTRNTNTDPPLSSPVRSAFNEPFSPRRSNAPVNQPTGLSRHAARNLIDLAEDDESSKHDLDEQDRDDRERYKKSRTDGDEAADGNDDPSWHAHASSSRRPTKRTTRHDDDDDDESDGIRDKRARKVSLEKNGRLHLELIEDMVIDEEFDEVPDLVSPIRGKKRDRAEAGSTFGGDDDDSGHEGGSRIGKSRRKRRTFAKRKSDVVLTVGRKRDRDLDWEDEDLGSLSEVSRFSRHHKKGKRHSNAYSREDGSDISIDESLASSAHGRRRRIGEEWESNGIRYKIGPNAQRLRQALVKRARSKFMMPRDSDHPDRNANLEVFVETWLTEEEYNEAKEQMQLAWQDSPKQSVEPESISVNIPQSKSSTPARTVGKNLLWQSTTSSPAASPSTASPLDSPHDAPVIQPKGLRNPGRYSLGANTGLHINPFEKPSSISAKRIASTSLVNAPLTSAGLTDKTNSYIRPRNLSKWEKQEVEARAIAQLRATKQAELDAKANEEREKAEKEKREQERVEREKLERERVEKERVDRERAEKEKKDKEAAAAAAAPKVPTITVTQASDAKPAATASSPFNFGPTLSTGHPPATAPAPAPAPSLFGGAPSTATSKPEENKPAAGGSLFSEFKPPAARTPSSAPSASLFSGVTPSSGSTAPPFGAPSPFGAAPSTSSTSSPFGAPTPEEKKDAPGGGSLFTRMGPVADVSGPAATPATNGSAFSLKPATGGSVFGQNNTTSTASSTTNGTSSTTAPKFNFGLASKAGTAAASSGDASKTASGSTGTGTGAAAPAPAQAFSFNPSNSTKAANMAPAPANTAPKFLFGAPGSGNMFGGATSGGSAFGRTSAPTAAFSAASTPTSAFGTTATPSSFGGSGATAQPPSAFGAAAAATFGFGSPDKGKDATTAAPKTGFGAFGGATSNGVFGAKPAGSSTGTSIAFGAKPPAATEAPKFSFGSVPSTSSTPATAGATPAVGLQTPRATGTFSFEGPPKPAALNTNVGSTTPAGTPGSATGSGAGGFSFVFGGAKPSGPGTGAAAASPFGAPAGTAGGGVFGQAGGFGAFGFGAPANGASTTTPAGNPIYSFGK